MKKATTKTSTISFSVSPVDFDIIQDIVKRAGKLTDKMGIPYPNLDCEMDLTACHANGTPLRLADLLAADEGNFAHDIFGIRRHLNRATGKLEGFFLPRYAAPKGAR